MIAKVDNPNIELESVRGSVLIMSTRVQRQVSFRASGQQALTHHHTLALSIHHVDGQLERSSVAVCPVWLSTGHVSVVNENAELGLLSNTPTHLVAKTGY